MPVAHACNFVYQAALGLQHAHEKGLVHRDIKPANLMLSKKSGKAIVKILDFGLAKVVREEKTDGGLTSEGQALGTPDYIAPEQILDAPGADIRADIYSLGVTLYHLLSGRPPFQARSLYDIYQAHISRDADPLNFVCHEVPTELAAMVAKMMAKDPRRRFQSPGDVAGALTPFFKRVNQTYGSAEHDVSRVVQETAPGSLEKEQPPSIRAANVGSVTDRPESGSETHEDEARRESQIRIRESEESSNPHPTLTTMGRFSRARRPAILGTLALGIVTAWVASRSRIVTEVPVPRVPGVATSPGKTGGAPTPAADSSATPAEKKAGKDHDGQGVVGDSPPSPVGRDSLGQPIYPVHVPLVSGGTWECTTSNPATWKVHAGMLYFEVDKANNHGLSSVSRYRDFELSFKVRTTSDRYPAIVVRSVRDIVGPVFESSGPRNARIRYTDRTLYSVPDALFKKLIRGDDFNEFSINCNNEQILIR